LYNPCQEENIQGFVIARPLKARAKQSPNYFGVEKDFYRPLYNCLYMPFTYYVYILTNKMNTVLYTGVTNDLDRRLQEHRSAANHGFTSRYQVHKLVYYEEFDDVALAIAREKQIKGGSRQKKIDLINRMNPKWVELLPGE
jgi:putative endonuclease